MQPAEPRELRVLEPRDHAEDPHLLAILQLGLEAHHVAQRAERIVLPELHHGIGLHVRAMRVGKPDRLHRPVAQRFAPRSAITSMGRQPSK